MMRAKGTTRYYCTIEQSKSDLEFKLGSMLAARAINEARHPDYGQGKFFCAWANVLKFLKDSYGGIEWGSVLKEAKAEVGKAELDLYDESSETQLTQYARAHDCLSREVTEQLRKATTDDHIKFRDGRSDLRDVETPLGANRSRLVLAARALDPVEAEINKGVHAANSGVRNLADRARLPIVVVDGLSLLSATERGALELQGIVERMRRSFQLGILVYEPNEDESTSLDHHADIVIQLEKRTIERPLAYLIHELCIRKARYQEAALGQHQFKIRGAGIEVFPSLHFQVHHYRYMDLELERSRAAIGWKPSLPRGNARQVHSTDSGSLIDMISAPLPGESIVLLGSRNSFKTQLSIDFLARGSWGCPKKDGARPKGGLLISLIDNAPDIQRGLSCPWRKTRQGNCEGLCDCDEAALVKHVRAFCQRPGCTTPSEFFHYVQERITNDTEIHRTVFWDLTQMDYRFPLFKEDKMLLPALMDKFKTKGLTALFMGAGNADNTRGASAMADHVLFCWRSRSVPKIPKKAARVRPVSSLMLYIDRASASSSQAGKAIYRLPVYKGDKLGIPTSGAELRTHENDGGYHLNPTDLTRGESDDKDEIARIVRMQGVA